jgi:hypothetical protein
MSYIRAPDPIIFPTLSLSASRIFIAYIFAVRVESIINFERKASEKLENARKKMVTEIRESVIGMVGVSGFIRVRIAS